MGRLILPFALLLAFLLPCPASSVEKTAPQEISKNLPPAGIEAGGMLKPVKEVKLASRSQGVIKSIKEEGSEVRSGEPVMTLEDAVENLQVQQQTQVLAMRAFEGKASDKLNSQDAISRIEAMEKSINYEVAKIQLEQVKELLNRRTVIAPFDGVVTERMRNAGEAVDEFVPVLTMVDLSRLYFEAYLPAANIRHVTKGQKAEVRVDSFPEKTFPGTVYLVSSVVNPASSEFKIRIVVRESGSDPHTRTFRLLPPSPCATRRGWV